jgi:TolB protein
LTFDNTITTSPDYGPTGRIAFYQEGAGRPSTPWVMNDDGGLKQELITGLSASIRYPQWDAQGTRVFTFVDQGTDQQHFAWIDLATRRLTKIPVSASGVAGWPSLSPDGQQVAFQVIGPDGVLNVWVQSLDTGDRRQVTFDQEAMSYPRWSPDGKWLAVNVSRGKSAANVGVVPVDGGPVEHLTSGAGLRWPYSFSPDGDLVAFAEARLGVWNIHTVSRRTREIKQLTTFTTGQAKYPAWSPSGNRIVFERREEVTGLWTLRLPGADLTASRRK